MVIQIRRYHIFAAVILAVLFGRAAIYSRETSERLVKAVELRPQAMAVPIPTLKKEISPIPEKKADIPLPAVKLKPLCLTFDDGPHPGQTERLLSILKEAHVRATFFVVGKQAELYPYLLKKIAQDGHELANHTYSHRNMKTLSDQEISEELEKTETLVSAATGKKMKYFRPPGGQYNSQVVAAAKARGYEMVLWSIFPQDHTNPPSALIRSRILGGAHKDGIVLLHSGVENTLETLPELIRTLKRRGYVFETVAQLRTEPHFQNFAKK